MRKTLRIGLVAFLTLLALPALADALVVVQVRTADGTPADGTVTLRPRGGGEARECQTERGNCRLEGVPGGQYTVSFSPNGGEATAPRPAMIPPSGHVTLHVAAP